MSKRRLEDTESEKCSKKACIRFKEEWLNEYVQADMPDLSVTGKRRTILGEIYQYNRDEGEVVCIICRRANAKCDFASGKLWNDWKLDYLKRHLVQKSHVESIDTLRSQSRGTIKNFLNETQEDRESRIQLSQRKSANRDEIKILIDNVLLAIQLNSSMLSVQTINNHMAKYVKIPDAWRSKNYVYEFLETINSVVKDEMLNNWCRSSFHTLIIDESTDISVSKMLILYVKFRNVEDTSYCTVFAGIIKLKECTSKAIVEAITQFYHDNELELSKMVMFTSDGASVMLGKNNGVAAILRRSVPHLFEQHCVAHREDLALDDAWKHVSLMKNIETLIRTVYSLFSRSSVKKSKFEELCQAADHDSVAFRPLNEVRWLSRDFAVKALVRNYDILIEYCEEQVLENNDPIHKYCLDKLTKPEYHVAIVILSEVLGELATLCRNLQRSNLTTIEASHLTRVKIMKLQSQYLGETVHFSDAVNKLLSSHPSVDTTAIIRFVERVCDHLSSRFPDNELGAWTVFDIDVFTTPEHLKNFTFGSDKLETLAKRYATFLNKPTLEFKQNLISQYVEFKLLISEKMAIGALKNFEDMIVYARQQDQFSDLCELLDICGTFQASSAYCERGFSLMNEIKTANRNRLKVDHLDMLMRIKLYLTTGHTVDLDKVHSFWKSCKGRRIASTAPDDTN